MIYCVEDDAGIRDMEIYTLRSTGFDAVGFESGAPFFEALQNEKPELVILDIMLPVEDGIEILKKLKASPSTDKIPVIMATAKGAEYDKIQGLDTGADDYLVKPFGMMEMVSRVKAVLRRCGTHTRTLTSGGITLDMDAHTVDADGKRIELTFKEFEILRLFLSRPGMVFTRDMLFSEVWGSNYMGETRTVDMHVKTLRQKLGECGKMIETVRGVGYRIEENR